MTDQTAVQTRVDSLYALDEKQQFGWRRVDGDKTKYFMVQNPEAWYRGCYATTIEPSDATTGRIMVYIVPGDTKISFKV